MTKLDIKKFIENFRAKMPISVYREYGREIDNALTLLQTQCDQRVAEAVEEERERIVVHIQRKGYNRQFAEDFINPN